MTAAPKSGSLWKSHCRDNFVCRTRSFWREANVPGEEAGKCTRETQRRMGPSAYARIAEIMSGRAEIRTGFGKSDCPGSQGGLRKRELW